MPKRPRKIPNAPRKLRLKSGATQRRPFMTRKVSFSVDSSPVFVTAKSGRLELSEDEVSQLENSIKQVVAEVCAKGNLLYALDEEFVRTLLGLENRRCHILCEDGAINIKRAGVHKITVKYPKTLGRTRLRVLRRVNLTLIVDGNPEAVRRLAIETYRANLFENSRVIGELLSENMQSIDSVIVDKVNSIWNNDGVKLSIYSILISDCSITEKYVNIEGELLSVLQPLFDELEIPANIRQKIIEEWSGRLVVFSGESESHSIEEKEQNTAATENYSKSDLSIFKRVNNLPRKAPAYWGSAKDGIPSDKLDGESPVDFIQRIYGPDGLDVLNEKGGLRRHEIQALDPHLYTSLRNWLQKNDLPADCPLPTKKEVTDAQAEALNGIFEGDLQSVFHEVRTTLDTMKSRPQWKR